MKFKIELLKSKLEVQSYKDLQANKRSGKYEFEYEAERLHYVLKKYYVPDWTITRKDGSKLYIEMKGYLRPTDRTKMVAVKQANPDLDIRLVFSVDNKINKSSKTRYSDWATKHGFPYAVGGIPKEWLTSPHI